MHELARAIHRKRHVALIVIRSSAVVPLVVGAYAAVQTVMVGRMWENPFGAFTLWGDGFSWSGRALGLLGPGAALAFYSKRIAEWIVPVPRNDCPKCGYPLRSIPGDTCPECGLGLGEAGGENP